MAIANHGIFPDVIGGMERHTYNLAKFLSREGVDIDVLVPAPKTSSAYPFRVHHLPWPSRPVWLWSNCAFSKRVGRWIEENRPDIAFGQGFNLWAHLPRRRVPCIFHPHGLEMYGQYQTGIERVKLVPFRAAVRFHVRNSDATVSLGGRLTEILLKQADLPQEKLIEIPNAVDLDDFPDVETQRRPRSLLFVGRLAFNKGVDLLDEALDILSSVRFSLTVIGDGPLRPHVEDLARRDERVLYMPSADEETLKRAYREHEGLLFTSRFEGMPTVILEAMASGCAVVATRIGAVEVMVDEKNGFLTDPSAEGIAEAIDRFLNTSARERAEMGRAGRRRCEAAFTWQAVTPAYLELFRRLARA